MRGNNHQDTPLAFFSVAIPGDEANSDAAEAVQAILTARGVGFKVISAHSGAGEAKTAFLVDALHRDLAEELAEERDNVVAGIDVSRNVWQNGEVLGHLESVHRCVAESSRPYLYDQANDLYFEIK